MKPLHFILLLIFLPSSIRCIYSFSQAANSLVFSHTRNRVFPELKYFLVLLLLASCTVTPKDDGTTPAPLFPQAKSFQSNPPGGYAINLVSGDSIDPILNMQGDTLKTGVHIPALGKIIHPDSVSRPKSFPVTPKGLLIKKNVYSNRKIISVNLTVILIDTSKLTYIPVPELVEGDTSHFIINSIGTKLATGTSIPTRGKVVPAIQPESEVALLPQIKDAAITNLQYLDVEQGMPSSNILSIAEDRNGNFWFGTWEGGVSKYDGAGFTTYTEKEGLSSNTVWTIEEDRSGNLWFGTEGGGVSKYDGSGFTHYSEKEGLSSKTVLSIVEDHNGNLWFGTRGGGVSKFNGVGFTHFTEKEGLSSNRVLSIAEDRRGNLWFGTEGGGVSKFDGKGFTHYTEKDGLSSNQVWSIVEDRKGNLWFGTEGGG